MDIQVEIGDRVTYENEVVEVLNSKHAVERAIGYAVKIIKIERPKWEVVEEKKELLTEEEREFLEFFVKHYEAEEFMFDIDDIDVRNSENHYCICCIDYPKGIKFKNVQREKCYSTKQLGLEE